MATLPELMRDIASAIRTKKGVLRRINPQDFAREIESIEGGGSVGNNQRVTYLRRTGNGYIDTGIQGNNSNLVITVRFAFRVLPSSYWNVIYAYKDENTNATRIICNGDRYIYGSLNSIASSSISFSQVLYRNVIYTTKLYSSSLTSIALDVNGVSRETSRIKGNLIDKNLLIFPATADNVDIELYSLKIEDNGVLVRDFYPHYKDGEFGLWDAVNSRFYGNSGDGTFGGQLINING